MHAGINLLCCAGELGCSTCKLDNSSIRSMQGAGVVVNTSKACTEKQTASGPARTLPCHRHCRSPKTNRCHCPTPLPMTPSQTRPRTRLRCRCPFPRSGWTAASQHGSSQRVTAAAEHFGKAQDLSGGCNRVLAAEKTSKCDRTMLAACRESIQRTRRWWLSLQTTPTESQRPMRSTCRRQRTKCLL